MDMLSKILKPKQGKTWPDAPPTDGMYYGVTGKHGERMVAMTQRTWESLGTHIEQQRRTMAGQDEAIKKQSLHIQALTADRDDAMEHLKNLRSNHRALLEERINAGLSGPAAPGLNLFPIGNKGS